MVEDEFLRPAVAAQRIGVRTLEVLKAMHARKVPRVRLADGTLGIPVDALGALSETVKAGIPRT